MIKKEYYKDGELKSIGYEMDYRPIVAGLAVWIVTYSFWCGLGTLVMVQLCMEVWYWASGKNKEDK